MTIQEKRRAEPLRPSSTKQLHRAATDKLRDLDFDPIDHMLEQLEEVQALINKEKMENVPRPRLLADLIAEKSKLLQAILPYRYGKAPVMTIESEDFREPIQINLTFNEPKKES